MKSYLELLRDVYVNGEDEELLDRTGVGTRRLFGPEMRIDLTKGFPLLTTKKMFFRGVVEELLFFLRGDTNTKKLEDKKVFIWRGNTTREFLDAHGLSEYPAGEMGPSYPWQWRNFGGTFDLQNKDLRDGVDQISNLIHDLKENPISRRHLVLAWNPKQQSKMALPPCHFAFQCFVSQKKILSLKWYQRSCDLFLGGPWNMAFYALLTHVLAKACGYEVGMLIFSGGDVHIYNSHFAAVEEQLSRMPLELPQVEILKPLHTIQGIENLTFSDFKLTGYSPYPKIKGDMAI